MSDVSELRKRIRAGRSAALDWLADAAPITELAEIMMAMANGAGGTVLLGVAGEPPQLVGVRSIEKTIDQVLSAALAVDPALILPMPRPLLLEGQQIVAVQIPAGMPHVYALQGRYLKREHLHNIPIKPDELRRMIIERGEISFETEPAFGTTLDDLDWDKARQYVSGLTGMRDNTPEDVLLKRGCLVRREGQLRPTNAGILLFGKDPQRHLRGAEITAARFGGETMSDAFSKQDITGTLPDQIRRAETFLVDHLRKEVLLKHTMERQEHYEYPLEAARELLVNAVAHRDYSISGDSIHLFIYSSRMEVTSPGRLPGPVTVANIKDERFSRNPAVVQVLSDMGFIERLGYGVDRVYELMQRHHLRAPQFVETAGGFRAVLHNQTAPEQPSETKKTSPALELASAELRGEYNGIPVNPRQEIALMYLNRDDARRITNSDLQSLCPDVHPETLRRDLADLVTKNILRKLGQKRGSYYVLSASDLTLESAENVTSAKPQTESV